MTVGFTFNTSLSLSSLLTLSDIAPKWASRFEQLPIPKLSLKRLQWGLELTAAEACLVGEAYEYYACYLQNCTVYGIIGSNF